MHEMPVVTFTGLRGSRKGYTTVLGILYNQDSCVRETVHY